MQRIDASIRENADVTVEETGLQAGRAIRQIDGGRRQGRGRAHEAGKAKSTMPRPRSDPRPKAGRHRGARDQEDLEQAQLAEGAKRRGLPPGRTGPRGHGGHRGRDRSHAAHGRQYIDRKKLTGHVLDKQKAEAEAHLQQVLQEQERGTMRSPVDGVVLDRLVSNEGYLPAGTACWRSAGLEDMEVEADMLSLDVVAAKVGDRGGDLRPRHRTAAGRRPSSPASSPPASPRSVRWASNSSG